MTVSSVKFATPASEARLEPSSGVEERAAHITERPVVLHRKEDHTEEKIITAAWEFYNLHGKLPTATSKEEVPGMPNENWNTINAAGKNCCRGLEKGRTLTKILKPLRKKLGIVLLADKTNFTEEKIIAAAREFYKLHGRLPNVHSIEEVPGMPDENWTAINAAGQEGCRGLGKGKTLSIILEPLRKELGIVSSVDKEDLTEEEIIKVARMYYKLHGWLPTKRSKEEVPGMLSENWNVIDLAGNKGNRGLKRGRTLSIILEPLRKELGIVSSVDKEDLTEEEIIKVARIYYGVHGKLPTVDSPEPVPGMPDESWTAINSAGQNGYRGLERGRTLSITLEPLRKELGIFLSVDKEDLTEEEIIKAARIYYGEHGKLPNSNSPESVPGMSNENWTAINAAGQQGYRGLEKGRTLSKILKPLRDSLGSSLTTIKLPKIFQSARLVKNFRTRNSDSKEIRSSLSLNKSRSTTFLKGEALEQVVGLLLLSRFPDQQVIPQYCLKVDPKQAYYGMRADYKVGDDIYEVKWGHATDNINETAEKHKKALGLKQANYRMILLNPNHEVKHDYASFHDLNSGLGVSDQLNQLVCYIQELTEANNSEVLEKLRDYFYGLVIKANSLENEKRISFLVKELDGLLTSDDKLEHAKKHSYALYSPLEAYFDHEGKLYRGLITPKALIEESPENYGLNYSLDDITFEDFRDLDLAVKLEMSSEYGPLRIEELLEEDRKYFDKAIFTLPDGLTVSYHEELKPELLIKKAEDIKDLLSFSDKDYEFAEEFMRAFANELN